ncbi:MAG: MarR family transcriptional regulator [Alphaproteobacteria bacterium]|nr:MarR family transcriptional regulator [Alphaproteobacteria bacterium]
MLKLQPMDDDVAGKRQKSAGAGSRSRTAARRRTKSGRRYDHLKLDETVGFLVADTNRTMTRAFSARIAKHGVGMGIFQFLRILWEQEGLTQSELAARARMRGPSAAGALHELDRRGFVRRIGDGDDGRKLRVHLTPAGRRLYDLVMPDIDVTNRVMLADFNPAEQKALKTMLHRMRRNLAANEIREKVRR